MGLVEMFLYLSQKQAPSDEALRKKSDRYAHFDAEKGWYLTA